MKDRSLESFQLYPTAQIKSFQRNVKSFSYTDSSPASNKKLQRHTIITHYALRCHYRQDL